MSERDSCDTMGQSVARWSVAFFSKVSRMRWFDREFAFPFPTEIYPNIVERLRGLAPRLTAKAREATNFPWAERIEQKWSAQENIGHLTDLEALWQGRLDDFAAGRETLRAADLENRKTADAGHNERPLAEVVATAIEARALTLSRLEILTPTDFAAVGLHPRLGTPMRLVDLLYFVAEHDDHHLARITALQRGL